MRSIGYFPIFVCLFFAGCTLDDSQLVTTSDAGVTADSRPAELDAPTIILDCGPHLAPPDPTPVAMWPRSHPVGTLLVDHVGDLWMVVSDGIREQVSGDDTLGEIDLDEHDATTMTLEEERCLTTSLDYWGPPNYAWQPIHGPEADPELYVLDWEMHIRHPVSYEALDSYGYFTPWLDYFDGGDDEWDSFTDGDPIGIRDGTIIHTEHGFYYVVHGRSFWFNPADLVSTAGYHPENALWMRDSRLRELAPASTSFDHETFNRCPADEVTSP